MVNEKTKGLKKSLGAKAVGIGGGFEDLGGTSESQLYTERISFLQPWVVGKTAPSL